MTEVAASGAAHDVTAASEPPNASHNTTSDVPMADVKTEDPSESISRAADADVVDTAGEEGDSEAETLIQSPEKKKNIVDNAPKLQALKSTGDQKSTESAILRDDAGKKSKKRKRDGASEPNAGLSRGSSSSPLSSPNPQAHSRDSDSDISDTPRSARSARLRRTAPKAESDGLEGGAQSKTRRRRPSDILPPSKHRARGSVGQIDLPSERRETRSATYPRQSSEERSPSPRPSSRRDHRRGLSTQITSGDVERKKRGRPPNISTRHNKSVERADTSDEDDDDDSSPAPRSRTNLDKYDSRDHMSPAKPSGPRKWRDKNGRTFLSRACNNEDLEKAKICLEERPDDINLPDNAGNSPLQIASLEGFTAIVRLLLENGAEVDTRNIDKDTPLIDAVENGHIEVVELLLRHGANPRLANAKGDEPYDLVPTDDENYKQIRKLIGDAKDQDWTKRRKSSDNNEGNGGSSRAASAASPRDSPPITGPRSPPSLASRRRTGRSESTRNDLLWQQNTQENLQRLASKGNVQGVATILNVLQKAEPASVIAAAKAGHEEVLQYLLAMGEADPDPDPQLEFKSGYNTPMLAAIGRGNLDVVKLLVEQTGFNPARKHKGHTYFEISAERKGESWQKEFDILKNAFDKYAAGKPKTKSPRKVRDVERPREKRLRRSESPPSSNLRTSSSPTITHKSLPDKSSRSTRRDGKKDGLSPVEKENRSIDLVKDDPNLAVASDQEQTVHDKRGHKHRRSQSDLPLPPNLEAEITQRRRRLISGKEHRRSQSGAGTAHSDGNTSEIDVKRERQPPGLKRNRSSVSPEAREPDAGPVVVKKRRTVLESSLEDSRSAPQPIKEPGQDFEMRFGEPHTSQVGSSLQQHTRRRSQQLQDSTDATKGPQSTPAYPKIDSAAVPAGYDLSEHDAPGETDLLAGGDAKVHSEIIDTAAADTQPNEEAELIRQQEEKKMADVKLAEEKQQAEEKAAVEREIAEKAAAEKAEAERLANEKAAAERAEAERRAAEEAEIKRKAEEAEVKRKAEEEAAARRKEQEDREEQKRRDLQRRQEEQIRQQHMEIERRRREALPAALCTAALLLENGDPRAKSHDWLSHFLPLYTVRTEQLQPSATPTAAQEEWIPNFQAATLLATKDLNLRNYTSIERRPATEEEKARLWKVGRHMLSYDYVTDSFNTTIKRAIRIEEEQRPKFMNMSELSWVKFSDFEDQVVRHEHLAGLSLKKQRVTIRLSGSNPYPSLLPNGMYAARPLVNGHGFHHPHVGALFANGGHD